MPQLVRKAKQQAKAYSTRAFFEIRLGQIHGALSVDLFPARLRQNI
jgi:hypothetical protein